MTSIPPPSFASGLGRRTLVIVAAAGLLAAPALLLRAFCVGESCRRQAAPEVRAPFCSLDPQLRRLLADGYRQGRSPEVLVVTSEDATVAGATGLEDLSAPWPSVEDVDAGRVPLVFQGAGIDPAAEVPAATPLVDLAPTAAAILDVRVPHPGVRSGEAIPGVAAGGPARLVVLVVWKGVGSDDLEASPAAWPTLRRLLREAAGTLDARVGSLPLDPTAVLTTIGTGGLPREHGITGSTLRNEEGKAVPAWGRGAPYSVIAALGDDLDEVLGQRPLVGLVGASALDRGVIGKDWHLRTDQDEVVLKDRAVRQADAAADLLAGGYGADDVPDLLAVVMHDRVPAMDRALQRVVQAVPPSTAVVVTSTGPLAAEEAVGADRIRAEVEGAGAGLTEAVAVGGLFLDQDVLVEADASQEDVIRALRGIRASIGGPMFADVFGGRAVEFGRYC
ncbi:MAG TPA: hypothetical protein VF097_01070 [Actinomycetota bacterium]